jgi:hypothetical protein
MADLVGVELLGCSQQKWNREQEIGVRTRGLPGVLGSTSALAAMGESIGSSAEPDHRTIIGSSGCFLGKVQGSRLQTWCRSMMTMQTVALLANGHEIH